MSVRPIAVNMATQRRIRDLVLAGLPPAWLYTHPRRPYLEALIKATPPWVEHAAMLELHRQKMELNDSTGVEHVLDHIVPLNHPYVCGLNVPWNIQIITRKQNAAKSNRWSDGQLELEI